VAATSAWASRSTRRRPRQLWRKWLDEVAVACSTKRRSAVRCDQPPSHRGRRAARSSGCDFVLRHGVLPRSIGCGHRVERLITAPVIVLGLEEEDCKRLLGLGSWSTRISVAGTSSGRPLSSISRFISSIRCLLTPSKVTTRANAIRASSSV
jgi:hypothetical protein